MNKGRRKEKAESEALARITEKTSSLCRTDLETFGINVAVKHMINCIG